MIDVRPTTHSDEAFVKRCIREAYTEFPRLLAQGEAGLDDAAENDYERIQDGFAHVATLNGQAVGAAWWLSEADPRNITVAYFVEAEARGQGVATRLVEAGLQEAKARGFRGTAIKTHPENTASIALAKKLGFQPVVALLRQAL